MTLRTLFTSILAALILSSSFACTNVLAKSCITPLDCDLGTEICVFQQHKGFGAVFDTSTGQCILASALKSGTTCTVDPLGKTNCGSDQVCVGAAPANQTCTKFSGCPSIILQQKNKSLYRTECATTKSTELVCKTDADCAQFTDADVGACEAQQPPEYQRYCLPASVLTYQPTSAPSASSAALGTLNIGTNGNNTEAAQEVQFKPIKANLEIPIPGVHFTDPNSILPEDGPDGKHYVIPYIAQYVGGVFRYALFTIIVIAMLTIMFAGVQWMFAGGNASTIRKAKTMITSAISGVFLAYASFAILKVIDPNLTQLKSISVGVVEPDPIMLAQIESGKIGEEIMQGESDAPVTQLPNGNYAGYAVPSAASCPEVVSTCKKSKNFDECMAKRQAERDMALEAQTKTGYPAGVMLAQLKLEGPTFGKKCKGGYVPSEKGNQTAIAKMNCSSQPNCNVGYTVECITPERLQEHYKLTKSPASRDYKNGQARMCSGARSNYYLISGYACFSGAAKGGNIFAPLIDFYNKHDCYTKAKQEFGANPYKFAAVLQSCRYATAGSYAATLVGIMKNNCLVGGNVPDLKKIPDAVAKAKADELDGKNPNE